MVRIDAAFVPNVSHVQSSIDFYPAVDVSFANLPDLPEVSPSAIPDTVSVSPLGWFVSQSQWQRGFSLWGNRVAAFATKRPDDNPESGRKNTDDPDGRDVPGESGRTGPNSRRPSEDSPGYSGGADTGFDHNGPRDNEPI